MRDGGENYGLNFRGFDASFFDGFVAGLDGHIYQRSIFTGSLASYDACSLRNPLVRRVDWPCDIVICDS
jgi:hypothetical protein